MTSKAEKRKRRKLSRKDISEIKSAVKQHEAHHARCEAYEDSLARAAADQDFLDNLLCSSGVPVALLTSEHLDIVGMLLGGGTDTRAIVRTATSLWKEYPHRMEMFTMNVTEAWNKFKLSEFDRGVLPEDAKVYFTGGVDKNGEEVPSKMLEPSREPSYVVTLLNLFGFIESNTISSNGAMTRKISTIKNGVYDGHEPDPLLDHSRKMRSLGHRFVPTTKGLRSSLNGVTFESNADPGVRYKVHPSALAAALVGAYTDEPVSWAACSIVQYVRNILIKMCDDLFFGLKTDYQVHIGPFINIENGIPAITHSTHVIIPSRGGKFYVPVDGWIFDEELGLGVANIMSELIKVQSSVSDTWFKLTPFRDDAGTLCVRVPMCLDGSSPRNEININNEKVRVTCKKLPVLGIGTYYAWHYPGSDRYKPVTYVINVIDAHTTHFWYIPWRGKPVQEKSIMSKLINKMYEHAKDLHCCFDIGYIPPVVNDPIRTPDSWALINTVDYGYEKSGITLLQVPLPRRVKVKGKLQPLQSNVNHNKWGMPVIAQEPLFDRAGNTAYEMLRADAMLYGTNKIGSGSYVFAGSQQAANELAVRLGARLYVTTRVLGSHVKTSKVAYKLRPVKDAGWLVKDEAVFADDTTTLPFENAMDQVLESGGVVHCAVPRLEDGTVNRDMVIRASLFTVVVVEGNVIVS